MYMATMSRWWTASDLAELPEDGCRYEVLEGELLEHDGSDAPLLVIEIHSPSTRVRDLGTKRAAYMALGIPEYWQVDLEARTVLVTRQGIGDQLASTTLEWRPTPEHPALRVDLASLFR